MVVGGGSGTEGAGLKESGWRWWWRGNATRIFTHTAECFFTGGGERDLHELEGVDAPSRQFPGPWVGSEKMRGEIVVWEKRKRQVHLHSRAGRGAQFPPHLSETKAPSSTPNAHYFPRQTSQSWPLFWRAPRLALFLLLLLLLRRARALWGRQRRLEAGIGYGRLWSLTLRALCVCGVWYSSCWTRSCSLFFSYDRSVGSRILESSPFGRCVRIPLV